jgi:hypothetical protein
VPEGGNERERERRGEAQDHSLRHCQLLTEVLRRAFARAIYFIAHARTTSRKKGKPPRVRRLP